MNRDVELVLNGMPLANPYVGIGVYTRRLIEALLHYADAPRFAVLLPSDAAEAMQMIPARNRILLETRWRFKNQLPREITWSHELARVVSSEFPGAVFHSPAPFWSVHRPKRTIITLHDCIYRRFPRYLGRFPIRKWLAQGSESYARGSSLVLTDSHCSANDLSKLGGIPFDKIQVLYPWVAVCYTPKIAQALQATVLSKFKLPPRFWLYVGGFDYRKNVETLIRAYALVRRQTTSAPPLVLAGSIPTNLSKPFCDVLGTLRTCGLTNDDVLMPGRIPEEDLPGFYAAAELFVYPSLYEGFGLPPAEAMAVQTPVLVSNKSSLPEVVRNRECLFDPTSTEGLANKLKQATENPKLFSSPLPVEFTGDYAIVRYRQIIKEVLNYA